MAVPTSVSNGQVQHMLQSAVQSVQWTYSLFWQFCPQQGILVWAEGYYNGAIKTRKTVQPSMEVSPEEVNLQRSQQIRELYDSMSVGESAQPNRRPSASLSPEDLTETEWFYLMCISFSFPPGDGLPGKVYATRQHVWLTGANEVDSTLFSRAILAKSAQIQTVVCIPLMDGVVEFGNTERVQEDPSFIQQVKSFFIDHYDHSQSLQPPIQPAPALSGHSTSNPTPSSSARSQFHSQLAATAYAIPNPTSATTNAANEEDDEEEDEPEAEAEMVSDSEAQTNPTLLTIVTSNQGFAQPSELMQLEMPEDIRLGSPEDASNNIDTDFCMVLPPNSQPERADSFKVAESSRRWPAVHQQQQSHEPVFSRNNSLQHPLPPVASLDELSQEDRHYSQTVSIVLQYQTSPGPSYLSNSPNSAFSGWNSRSDGIQLHLPVEGTSQWLLKYILFRVPYLHAKHRADNSITSPNYAPNSSSYTALARLRQGKGAGIPQDELSANHVLAERRRREKLNERFIILRSLVPFVTKMDKASILGDTIEYVKQLRNKIQELEARAKQRDLDHNRLLETTKSRDCDQRNGSTGLTAERGIEKRKVRVMEGGGATKGAKAMEMGDMLQVSIIENDALVELQCPYKEGLLLDVMLKLRDMRLEVTAVQSSLNNGLIAAELRAKVKGNGNGKKASIVEVKKAVYQTVAPAHTDS